MTEDNLQFEFDPGNPEEELEYFEIQMIVINQFGEFCGVKAQVSKFHCDNIMKMSKTFYINGGFELTCEDGSFVVFPPEIVQKSILKINKIPLEIVEEEQEEDK